MIVQTDEDLNGIPMIPLFSQYGITRCNIVNCKEKHTTICIHESATFGLCEKHYLEGVKNGSMKLSLEFD